MKNRRFLAVFLALVIAAGIFVLLGTRKDNSRGMVTLWYEKDSPLADKMEKLVREYNSDIKRETLPVEVKCFETEAELAEAYETGTPDILLCSHLHAFSLYQRDRLADISGEETFTSPSYSQNVRSRSDSIGTGFFPIGFSLPVTVLNNSLVSRSGFDSFEEVFAAASDYTRKTGKPFFSFSSIAEQYCLYMLRSGEEFNADFDGINRKKQYLELYNRLAEATFEGSIAYLGEDGIKYLINGAIPCVFTTSEKLDGMITDTVSVYGVPEPEHSAGSDMIGTAYGFAVTNGGCRSKRDTAAFISWVFSGDRDVKAALASMLAPTVEGEYTVNGAIEALLCESVKNKLISLPAPDSEYILNRAGFDESFIREMERLMP